MKNKKRGLFLALPLFAALSLGSAASAEAKPKNFSHQEYATSGTWHIESEGGKRYIVLSKKFRTAAGPDLKIYLSPHKIKGISGRNVTKGALQIAPLKKNRGAQRYQIPAGVNLDQYSSIAIHCRKYSKLFAASALH